MAPTSLAAVLITGALATAGVIAIAEHRADDDVILRMSNDDSADFSVRGSSDEFEGVDSGRAREFSLDVSGPGIRRRFGMRIDEEAPSVTVDVGDAGRASFQVRRGRNDDDEDTDGDTDSERRGRVVGRDRDRFR